jgi:hypothetical protein
MIAQMDRPLVPFTIGGFRVSRSAANIMKLPYFSLFSVKRDCETPEPSSFPERSGHHLISKPVLLIPLRAPSDQLQIVVFPAILI